MFITKDMKSQKLKYLNIKVDEHKSLEQEVIKIMDQIYQIRRQ